jgi:hypothetical protein
MRTLGRVGVLIAFLLLVLAGTSWAGLMLAAPYYFLVPAVVILAVVVLATMVPRHRKHAMGGPH